MNLYRKSYEVVGYTFQGAIYCLACSENLPETDQEGNPKNPVFLDQINDEEPDTCDTCLSSSKEW